VLIYSGMLLQIEERKITLKIFFLYPVLHQKSKYDFYVKSDIVQSIATVRVQIRKFDNQFQT